MDDDKTALILDSLIKKISSGFIRFTLHALEEMEEGNYYVNDIIQSL